MQSFKEELIEIFSKWILGIPPIYNSTDHWVLDPKIINETSKIKKKVLPTINHPNLTTISARNQLYAAFTAIGNIIACK